MYKTIAKAIFFIVLLGLGLVFLNSSILNAFTLESGMYATEIVAGDGAVTQDFTTSTAGLSALLLDGPFTSYMDTKNDRFYVADSRNARILVYNLNTDDTFSDYVPDYVLGQSDFVSGSKALTQTGLVDPIALAYDTVNDYLFVVDSDNDLNTGQRVLVYDARDNGSPSRTICASNGTATTGIVTGMAASCVIGQEDFVSELRVTDQDGFDEPSSVAYDSANERLFVGEIIGARVMVFDLSGGISDGMNATYVLGKESFVDNSSVVVDQDGLLYVYSLLYSPDLEYLFVNDALRQRIMVFDARDNGSPAQDFCGNGTTSGLASGMDASCILGQTDFVTDGTGVTPSASKFGFLDLGGPGPYVSWVGMTYDATNEVLFAADTFGSRILGFDLSDGITNGEAADTVIGQDDFASVNPNRGGSVAQDSLNYPFGVQYVPSLDRLYIADVSNSRILEGFIRAEISYSVATVDESSSNNGSIDDTIIATVTDDIFSSPVLVRDTHYTISNLPAGLDIPAATVDPGLKTEAVFSFTGNATNHESSDSISNLTITFLDAAFVSVDDASNVENYSFSSGVISFDDAETESDTSDPGGEITEAACWLDSTASTINAGEFTTLTWGTNISGYDTAVISPYGNVDGDAEMLVVSPTVTTTYQASFSGGFASGTAHCGETITVIGANQNDDTEEIEIIDETEEVEIIEEDDIDIIWSDDAEEVFEDIDDETEEEEVEEDTVALITDPEFPDTFNSDGYSPDLTPLVDFFRGDTAKALTGIGLILGLAVAALTTAFAGPLTVSELVLLPARLWSLLLSALGLKKKERPWGMVYDSYTKQPLDPVYVVLKDEQGNEVQTAITDMDGRYGFVVDVPGRYSITAGKSDYSFPSSVLAGQTNDHLYQDLYFGEMFTISEAGAVITKNIPLDATAVNWNEEDKRKNNRLKFYKKRDYFLTKLGDKLFMLGFLITIIAVIAAPVPYNIITFGLYVLLGIVRHTGLQRKKHGSVVDQNNNPIPHAIVRIFSTKLDREVKHTVADKYGRFHMIVPNGDYKLVVETPSGQDSYQTVIEYPMYKVAKGIVGGVLKI